MCVYSAPGVIDAVTYREGKQHWKIIQLPLTSVLGLSENHLVSELIMWVFAFNFLILDARCDIQMTQSPVSFVVSLEGSVTIT